MVMIRRGASDIVCTEMSLARLDGNVGGKVRVQAFTDIHDNMDTSLDRGIHWKVLITG
jgi:hypothetical protein